MAPALIYERTRPKALTTRGSRPRRLEGARRRISESKHCRQTQNCHCEKYFRVGRHPCQKIDHLALPSAVGQRQKKNTAIASTFQRDRENGDAAICAFRFVIFITSSDPAWETGPNRGCDYSSHYGR